MVWLMWLFPRLMWKRRISRRLFKRVVQPAMPVRINAARLNRAVKHNPTEFAVTACVIDIALAVLAHAFSLAPRIELGVERRAVPPCGNSQDRFQNAHESLRKTCF